MGGAKDRIRTKNRKNATPNVKTRSAQPGTFVIFVDSEATEKNYFRGLGKSNDCRAKMKLERVAKIETALREIKKRTLLPREETWLVFDKDEVETFDQIITDAEKAGINVGWSNPCFEIWLHAYFGEMPSAQNSVECVDNFKRAFKRKTNREYKKNDNKIFEAVETYGSFEDARKVARTTKRNAQNVYNKPSQQAPATNVHELVEKLRGLS